MRLIKLGFLCAVVALLTVACGEDTPTAPDPPPTPTQITDTFTGTLNTNGAASHNFLAAAAGVLTASLTQLDPEITVGFAVGTWNGTVCQVVLARDQAVKTTVIYGNVNTAGDLCVRVYDVGNVTAPTTYEIQVVHP